MAIEIWKGGVYRGLKSCKLIFQAAKKPYILDIFSWVERESAGSHRSPTKKTHANIGGFAFNPRLPSNTRFFIKKNKAVREFLKFPVPFDEGAAFLKKKLRAGNPCEEIQMLKNKECETYGYCRIYNDISADCKCCSRKLHKRAVKYLLKKIEKGCDSSIFEQYNYWYADRVMNFIMSWDKVSPLRFSDKQKAEIWFFADFPDGEPDMNELCDASREAVAEVREAMYGY